MSIEERYKRAVAYVHRAVDGVERAGFDSSVVDWYAARNRTEPARNELAHVEAQWLRATTDIERARVARDAELLADRTQESLPGAPQDRERTNLWPGETPTSTPATSYGDELAHQAHAAWDWTKDALRQTGNDIASLGMWLLVVGGIVLGVKVLGPARQRQAASTQRTLNRRLVRLAETHEQNA